MTDLPITAEERAGGLISRRVVDVERGSDKVLITETWDTSHPGCPYRLYRLDPRIKQSETRP